MSTMKLPQGDQVKRQQIIDKLITYALNEDHKDGKHKARLFKSKLGITVENKEILVKALIQVAKKNDCIFSQNSQYGQKYVIDFYLITGERTEKIRSAWIIRYEEDYPRLTTVYPLD
jgi:hypothetical protein